MKMWVVVMSLMYCGVSATFEKHYSVLQNNIQQSFAVAEPLLEQLLQNVVVDSRAYTQIFKFLYDNNRYDLMARALWHLPNLQLTYSVHVLYSLFLSRIRGDSALSIDHKILLLRAFARTSDWVAAVYVRFFIVKAYRDQIMHDIDLYHKQGGSLLEVLILKSKAEYILSNELKMFF